MPVRTSPLSRFPSFPSRLPAPPAPPRNRCLPPQPEGVRIPGVWFENVGNLFLVMDEFQMRYRSPAFQRRINHAPKLYRFAVTGTAFKNNAWAQWRFFENCFPGLFLNENFSMIHGFLEKSRHRDFIPTQLDDATLKLIKTFFVKVWPFPRAVLQRCATDASYCVGPSCRPHRAEHHG